MTKLFSLVILIFHMQARAVQNQCPTFYGSNSVPNNSIVLAAKIESLQSELIRSTQSPSIQSTVAAEFYIRSLRKLLGTADFKIQEASADVNDLSFRVSEVSKKTSSNETVLKQIDAIKSKIKILKEKKAPTWVSLRGQKDAYLNSIALDIKKDFKIIKDESNVSEATKGLLDSLAKSVLDYTLDLEHKLASFIRYQTALLETVKALEQLRRSEFSFQSMDSLGLVLNQIMLEASLAFQNENLINEAIKSLKAQTRALQAAKNAASSISEIELSVFLMETGLSPAFIESEISERASELEEKNRLKAQKAAANQAKKDARKAWFKTHRQGLTAIATLSSVISVAGFHITEPSIDTYVLGFHNSQAKQIIDQSHDLTLKERSSFLLKNLPMFEDQLTVNDFITYMNQEKPRSGYEPIAYAHKEQTVKAFFIKRIKKLTYKEVVAIGDLCPDIKNSLIIGFIEYQQNGKIPTLKDIN